MEKIKVRFDPTDNVLLVWFDDPQHMAYLSPIEEEGPGECFLIRNEAGQVIGLECRFDDLAPGSLAVELETAPLLVDRAGSR